ncbi:MAG: hypothetical protein KKG60_01605 [Nanoarchaeota archaeon]|nr:hypothetical protein [Nanoarchaeota archaeon]
MVLRTGYEDIAAWKIQWVGNGKSPNEMFKKISGEIGKLESLLIGSNLRKEIFRSRYDNTLTDARFRVSCYSKSMKPADFGISGDKRFEYSSKQCRGFVVKLRADSSCVRKPSVINVYDGIDKWFRGVRNGHYGCVESLFSTNGKYL